MKPAHKVNHGFTLIELLVVVSIIGLLSSIVLASLGGARDKAVAAKQIATVKQIQNAMALYNLEYKTLPPVPQTGNGITSNSILMNAISIDNKYINNFTTEENPIVQYTHGCDLINDVQVNTDPNKTICSLAGASINTMYIDGMCGSGTATKVEAVITFAIKNGPSALFSSYMGLNGICIFR